MPIPASEIRVGAVYEGGPDAQEPLVVLKIDFYPDEPQAVFSTVGRTDGWKNGIAISSFARWATKEVSR